MAYITKSNLFRIIANMDVENMPHKNEAVYKKTIYFLSEYEKNKILAIKKLLDDPEGCLKFYKPIKNADTETYIFEGGNPSYHESPDCEKLNSNFRNIKIPDTIRKKGSAEIQKFRVWYINNSQLLKTGKLREFTEKIYKEFDIKTGLEVIEHENSGIENFDNLNLEQLEQKIDKILYESVRYYKDADTERQAIIKQFQKYTYLAYSVHVILNNTTRFSDDAIKRFLLQFDVHFKIPIKNMLLHYHRVKLNPELKFKGELLERLGFKPCTTCGRNPFVKGIDDTIKNETGDLLF